MLNIIGRVQNLRGIPINVHGQLVFERCNLSLNALLQLCKANIHITRPSLSESNAYPCFKSSIHIESKSGPNLTLSDSNAYTCLNSRIHIESKSGPTLPSRILMPTLAYTKAYTLKRNLVLTLPSRNLMPTLAYTKAYTLNQNLVSH
jgi:hypothetical protein